MTGLRSNLRITQKMPAERVRDLAWYLGAVLIPVAVFTFVLATARVSGSSMLPGLSDGDFIVCLRHAAADYGDVVLLRDDSNRVLVKRVEGLPGDEIQISGGVLYRNGIAVDEAYLFDGSYAGDDFDALTVPDGKIFVLGDNRNASMDSRSDKLGCVAREDLIGKMLFRLGGGS